eukprot:355240-Chlamydomonas_euryale.AAC.1
MQGKGTCKLAVHAWQCMPGDACLTEHARRCMLGGACLAVDAWRRMLSSACLAVHAAGCFCTDRHVNGLDVKIRRCWQVRGWMGQAMKVLTIGR